MALRSQPSLYWFLFALFCYIFVGVSGFRGRGSDLQPPEKEEILRTDGGKVESWGESFKQFADADVGAVTMTLEPDGLLLPRYSVAASVYYVTEGCARVGVYYPWGFATNTRTVTKGDVVVVPPGWVSWFWNDGEDKLRVFGVGDTTASNGKCRSFFLMGGEDKHYGGILNGFNTDVLSRSWDVSKDVVEKLLKAQKGVGIVQVERGSVNMAREDHDSYEVPMIGDFRYNIDKADPDFEVEDGGFLTALTHGKLPVLGKVGFGVARGRLEKGAILAPHWFTNGHVISYFTKGCGRVQIASPDGRTALDQNVEEGDIILLPRFYPIVKLADEDSSLEWLSVITNSAPETSFLAGRLGLFNQIPSHIRRAAFNIDKDLDEKLYYRRRGEAVIFPPRREDGTANTRTVA